MLNLMGGMVVLVGFFGKLLGVGDFVQWWLLVDFVECWDCYFEYVVVVSCECLGECWYDVWYVSLVWCFVLVLGVCGEIVWVGVMVLVFDCVGCCFLMVMVVVLGSEWVVVVYILCELQCWFDVLEYVYVEVCYYGLVVEVFDVCLVSLFGLLEVLCSDLVVVLQGIDWCMFIYWCMLLCVYGYDEVFLEMLWQQVVVGGGLWCLWWIYGVGVVLVSVMLIQGLLVLFSYVVFFDVGYVDDNWCLLCLFGVFVFVVVLLFIVLLLIVFVLVVVVELVYVMVVLVVVFVVLLDDFFELFEGIGVFVVQVLDDIMVLGFVCVVVLFVLMLLLVFVFVFVFVVYIGLVELLLVFVVVGMNMVYCSFDGVLIVLVVDDGVYDLCCCGVVMVQVVVVVMQLGEFFGGMQKLCEWLLVWYVVLQVISEDLIDLVMEDVVVIVLYIIGCWVVLLCIGIGEVWQW